MKRLFIFIIASLIFSLILEKEGGAIPAFARKYRTSCTTCHVVFPKLNDFGEAFRANGFQIPQDDEIYVKDEPVSLGAEEWKMMWPYSVWPGEFPHLPPIAFLTRFAIKQREKGDVKGDFTFPETFLFLVGGTLGRDISFFGHIGEGRRVYIQFNNLFDNKIPRYALNLRIGLFEPGVVAFSNERRLTVVQNLFSTFNLEFANGNANISLINIPITRANCVHVPKVPRSVGGAISPKYTDNMAFPGILNGSKHASSDGLKPYFTSPHLFDGLPLPLIKESRAS